MNSLVQRKLIDVREFTLQEKGVNFKQTSKGNSYETFIPFENITMKTDRVSISNRKWFIASVVFIIAFLVTLISRMSGSDVETFAEVIWGGLAFVTYIMYWNSKNDFVIIRGGEENLPFYKNIPNTKIVDDFIKDMFKNRKEYLRNKYGIIDKDFGPQENINRFRWLKDNEIISQEEYEELKRTVENMVHSTDQKDNYNNDQSKFN